ncbi:MAG TPA: IclR family transcriptional regulator [Gaiellales bacterium]|jgi:DNA-binding IclR family transcriptional regulator|nr:IclR family transcriptional regulator [Gaiellales bacterium]
MRRGVEVLLALGSEQAIAQGGLGVTRIAEQLGREKSQISRTLKILAEHGLVDRDPDTLAYRLGWRIFALANLAGERRLLDEGRPLLQRLVARLSERAHVSVLQGTDTLTIASESSAQSLQAVGWVGRMVPAYCTSVGQALLLDHSRAELGMVFEDVRFERLGPNTARNVAQLAARIEAARERGYALADEEMEPGLLAVAAPVRDAHGRIVAALNVSGPRFRLIDRLDVMGREVAAAGVELSKALGGIDGA